jgi:hypothetical protein
MGQPPGDDRGASTIVIARDRLTSPTIGVHSPSRADPWTISPAASRAKIRSK